MSRPQVLQGTTSDIKAYNILQRLGGVGLTILVHAVHEMEDATDIRTLLCTCRDICAIMQDKLFGWSVARALSKSYSLRTLPIELTDIVCVPVCFISHLHSFLYSFLI